MGVGFVCFIRAAIREASRAEHRPPDNVTRHQTFAFAPKKPYLPKRWAINRSSVSSQR